MLLIEAVILGIVQGITEFLPVSSSGHLALFHALMNTTEDDSAFRLLFNVTVHMGTLVSVFIVLRKEIWGLIRRPFQRTSAAIIIATLPIVATALLFRDHIRTLDENMIFLMAAFTLTGLLLLYADCVRRDHLTKEMKKLTLADALIVGFFQAVAIVPAISRSGATTAAALFRKLNRQDAAKFVFLLSIPAILGAAVMEGMDLAAGGIVLTLEDSLNLLFGFIAALMSGYLAVSLFFSLIQRAKLRYFSYYLFALAAFICIDTFVLQGMFFGN